jgi:hypothetical protein
VLGARSGLVRDLPPGKEEQASGGDLARPLTDRRLDTPSGIPLEAQL